MPLDTDYTASGRSLGFIEDFIRREVLPLYANTHTETSGTGLQTTRFREDARQIIAKISREEVAARFFAPPPERFLQKLVVAGELTAEQAQMAAEIPMAQDVTVESDSGGHTDNRPALALFPTIRSQKNACQKRV